MPPLIEQGGGSYSACHAAQIAKPQTFALRQPACNQVIARFCGGVILIALYCLLLHSERIPGM